MKDIKRIPRKRKKKVKAMLKCHYGLFGKVVLSKKELHRCFKFYKLKWFFHDEYKKANWKFHKMHIHEPEYYKKSPAHK